MLAGEITRQRVRLNDGYAVLSSAFVDVFDNRDVRIKWRRKVLVGVSGLVLAGALLATFALVMLIDSGSACYLNGG